MEKIHRKKFQIIEEEIILKSQENESKSKQAFTIVQRKREKNEAFGILPS